MNMDDYMAKRKELEDMEKKAIEIKKTFRMEKRHEFMEKLKKFNLFGKMKPWVVVDLFLFILIIALFLVAYNHNNAEDSNGGFFGIFGFSTKDKSEDVIIEDNQEVVEEEPEDVVNATNVTVVTTEIDEEEPEEIKFNIWAKYGEDEFGSLETSSSSVIYYVVIENIEGFPIKCENPDNSVEIDAYDSREIFNRAAQSDAGDDNKIVKEHKFTCYKEGESISDGTEKSIEVTITFI